MAYQWKGSNYKQANVANETIPAPTTHPFASQRRLMDQSQATSSPASARAKQLWAYYQHHCHISSNERAATMAANPIMT